MFTNNIHLLHNISQNDNVVFYFAKVLRKNDLIVFLKVHFSRIER